MLAVYPKIAYFLIRIGGSMQLNLDINSSPYFSNSAINKTDTVVPFKTQLLKWIGNKQRFAHEIISYFPKEFNVYHEPFLGSGAVLGVLSPTQAEASDCFKPLMEIWKALRYEPNNLKKWYDERWGYIHHSDKKTAYEAVKARFNDTPNGPDLLFLSRSAYGGVMRFRMRDGYMSTPCGAHDPIHPGTFSRRVDLWHRRVSGTEFRHQEYGEAFERVSSGDVVYCDPPYSHSQAILYGAQSFNQDDLFREIEVAKRRGAFVALSLDGSKKSGSSKCDYEIPKGLFERSVSVNCGRSMLRRFQMAGKTLEGELVSDRLLLTH